jgi:hypothetical protein
VADDDSVPRGEFAASDKTPVFATPRNPFEALQHEFKVLEFRVVRDSGAALAEVAALGAQVESEFVDLRGKSGNNGKIGTLRVDVKSLRGALIAVAIAVLGGVGASAKALYTAGEMRGAERAEFERLRETVKSLTVEQAAHAADLLLLKNGILPAKAGSSGGSP